jgi:sulfite reductase (NADPH) flavoprotein alpha-component
MIRTACSYCGVGCGMNVETRTDLASGAPVIARVTGDRLHPTNLGRLCTKGATHAEMMAATEGRLTTALLRPSRGADPVATDVDHAIAEAGRRLRAIIDRHGPDAVAVYVSGQMSLESQYLATKLAKGFVRTRHLESNSRLCMASAATGYKQSLGADGPPGSYSDIDSADLFFVLGSNTADCHPILFLRMAERQRAGAKLIVVDPRRTATADKADLYLPIRPGTDLALLNGILHLLVENGAIDEDFIAEHTQGWAAMPAFLAGYPPGRVAAITGLPEADIRTAATMIAEAGEWMTLWTMGLNQSTHGTQNTTAICNLHLATGAICRPGSGPLSLTGQPNAMGGREMGYLGPGLPGQRVVTSAPDRAFVEEQWGLPPGTIRAEVGPGTVEMFRGLAAGDIKAVWIICTNPVASMANRGTVLAGLAAAELVIVQDTYADTATTRHADIVLPAALWAESDAVMVNSERTLTLQSQCVPPLGAARPDWQLICDVARQLGYGHAFDFASSRKIFDEIRRFANPRTGYDLRGITYDRLRRTPVQWPCPTDGAPDRNPIRYLNDGVSQTLFTDHSGHRPRLAFPTPSRRAMFLPQPHLDAAELPDDQYPVVLNTGRLQHQWHTMTKTGRIDKLTRLDPAPFVEIHPDDAGALGVTDGHPVEVTSRRGRAVLPAVVTDRVRPGATWAPFHWNDTHGEHLTVNALTHDAVDPASLQPEFKVCAVALRPLPVGRPSESPAPRLEVLDDGPLVLWASQTGNAEEFATGLGGRLGARLAAMDDIDPVDLQRARDVVVVTSTFGDGGPPDNGTGFWERLTSADAPALDGVRYTVLGLGDRAYDNFCGHAKSLDARLADLGATRVLNRADCEVYEDAPITRWADAVAEMLGGSADPVATAARPFTRAHPVRVPLCRNVRLTPVGAAKDVRQFGVDISGHDVDYAVGDSLGVIVANSDIVVEQWLSATRFAGSETVVVDGVAMSLRDAVTRHYDVCKVTGDLVTFVAGHSPSFARLRRDRTALDRWLVNRNGLDLVTAFTVRADLQEWQDVLVRLTPRQYSISSSPLVSPHEVQLTVSVVRYGGPDGRSRGGVGSTYLAESGLGETVPVFLQRSPHFRPPAHTDTPMIMVGPGTGVAPFRAFLQERRALGHTGRNWLFFGDQHRAQNFYYRDDLTDMVADGFLDRLDLAFSRDQQQRVYVQHRMIEHGAEVWRWLSDGAHLFVCGDASRMASDVDAALTAIIRRHGRMTEEAARAYKRELVGDKRYVRDVY